MASVSIVRLNRTVDVDDGARLMDVFVAEGVEMLQACGGRGICATCHVHVVEGDESLSAPTAREQRTLARLADVQTNSRLACQARVLGPGVVADAPKAAFVQSFDDLLKFIGKRTRTPIRHPSDGRILVQAKKIITRTAIGALESLDFDLGDIDTQ